MEDLWAVRISIFCLLNSMFKFQEICKNIKIKNKKKLSDLRWPKYIFSLGLRDDTLKGPDSASHPECIIPTMKHGVGSNTLKYPCSMGCTVWLMLLSLMLCHVLNFFLRIRDRVNKVQQDIMETLKPNGEVKSKWTFIIKNDELISCQCC